MTKQFRKRGAALCLAIAMFTTLFAGVSPVLAAQSTVDPTVAELYVASGTGLPDMEVLDWVVILIDTETYEFVTPANGGVIPYGEYYVVFDTLYTLAGHVCYCYFYLSGDMELRYFDENKYPEPWEVFNFKKLTIDEDSDNIVELGRLPVVVGPLDYAVVKGRIVGEDNKPLGGLYYTYDDNAQDIIEVPDTGEFCAYHIGGYISSLLFLYESEDEPGRIEYGYDFTPYMEGYYIETGITYDFGDITLAKLDEDSEYGVFEGNGYFLFSEPVVSPNPGVVMADDDDGIVRFSAIPTAAKVLVDGLTIEFDAYEIGGYNYFKLRDLAYALSGSEKQFEVGWDEDADTIALTSGEPYTLVGGEMLKKGTGEKTAAPTGSTILKDGVEIVFTAFNIEDNNYFKLRDIGAAFDFGVEWDEANYTIIIDTANGYVE